MQKFWYRFYEVTALVYLPVVGVFFVYGTGRLFLLGDLMYFAETVAMLGAGLLIVAGLGIVIG